MALKFEWYPRTPGEDRWEDDIRYDRWGRAGTVEAMRRDAEEAGYRLRSLTPEAALVIEINGVWQITEEAYHNARPAWVWWAE